MKNPTKLLVALVALLALTPLVSLKAQTPPVAAANYQSSYVSISWTAAPSATEGAYDATVTVQNLSTYAVPAIYVTISMYDSNIAAINSSNTTYYPQSGIVDFSLSSLSTTSETFYYTYTPKNGQPVPPQLFSAGLINYLPPVAQ